MVMFALAAMSQTLYAMVTIHKAVSTQYHLHLSSYNSKLLLRGGRTMARKLHPKQAECFEFVWRRRVKGFGFRWKQHPNYGRLLVGPPQEALQPYEPLVEETGLFLTFAHLDGSENDFLQFANTYGRLGTYHNIYPELGEPLEESLPSCTASSARLVPSLRSM
jgi:hypothetical protein